MPRKPRFRLPGVPQHVIQRGNNRQTCFFGSKDYRLYLDWLGQACDKYGCVVHAYVLMSNHVHLLVTPERPGAVGLVMQSLGRRYVRYVNNSYRRTGTLWEGRYKASLVEDETYLLTCYRYIELNPVRARMVERPGDYRWSSYAYNALGRFDPYLTPHPVYLRLGNHPEERRHAYSGLFPPGLDEDLLKTIREALDQELVLGSERFKDVIEATQKRRARPGKSGRPRREGERKGNRKGTCEEIVL
jgi:putative transposase